MAQGCVESWALARMRKVVEEVNAVFRSGAPIGWAREARPDLMEAVYAAEDGVREAHKKLLADPLLAGEFEAACQRWKGAFLNLFEEFQKGGGKKPENYLPAAAESGNGNGKNGGARAIFSISPEAALNPEIVMVTSAEDLRSALAEVAAAGVCGLDTETAGPGKTGGLDPHVGEIRLVQVAVPSASGVKVFVADMYQVRDFSPFWDLWSDDGVLKVLHNAKFDLKFFRKHLGRRLPLGRLFDTMLASQLIACGLDVGSHSLAACCQRFLGVHLDKEERLSDWSRELSRGQIEYAAKDPAVLLPLAAAEMKGLAKEGLNRVARIEFDCVFPTSELEFAGIGFDKERCLKLLEEEEAREKEAREKLMRELAPALEQGLFGAQEINPNSPAQLLPALRKLGLDVASTLDDELRLKYPDHPAVKALLEYRKCEKRLTAFLRPYLEAVHPVTGRVHASFTQINKRGVGRFSCQDPNVQQCYDDKTEILTRKGWKLFSDLSHDDEVAQYDPDSGKIEFVVPEQIISYEYTGELISIKRTHVDLLITPEHRCFSINRRSGKHRISPAKAHPLDGFFVHSGVFSFGQEKISKEEIVLICATQADGTWHDGGIEFVLRRPRKIERLCETLQKLGVNYSIHDRKNKPGYKRIRIFTANPIVRKIYGLLGDKKTFGPWLLNWTKESAEFFLREVMFWDGCWTRKNHYETKVKENADWVQIIACLLGKRARIRNYGWNKKQNPNHSINYQVDLTNRNYSHIAYTKFGSVFYKGKVYCVTVPTGLVLVRRNGCTVVSGNSPREKEFRALFAAPESRKLVICDYGQIELRIMAWLSKDVKMVEAYRRGLDLHTLTASLTANVPIDQVTKEMRQKSKSVNFGMIYGMAAKTFQQYAKTNYGVDLSLEEATALRDAFFRAYPGVAAWHKKQKAFAQANRFVCTVAGRKRKWLEGQVFPITQAFNTPDQGSGADILKTAMAYVYGELFRKNLEDVFIVNSVHDELLLECPENMAEETAVLVKEKMEKAWYDLMGDEVPIEAEPVIGNSWADK